jgi:hypothetical protein
LEFENRLKKQGEFQRGDTASPGLGRSRFFQRVSIQDRIMANLHNHERRHRPMRLRVSQEPAQEKLFRLLEPWLAQKNHSEQQDRKRDPDGGSLHRGRSEEVKVAGDKWQDSPALLPLPISSSSATSSSAF